MLFSVDRAEGGLEGLKERDFSELDVLERRDFQEWAIEDPRILGEDLLVITSEYPGFYDTRDRLDLLAIDGEGKLVVVELKRDTADMLTDLQAIKYASYCSTLTAEDIQKMYREFWNDRDEAELSPEDVGERFVKYLSDAVEGVHKGEEGWAEFDLNDKPRILLAAGEFGIEVTSPVMWLTEEYGLDITCTRISAYEHEDRILLNAQQIIPVPEAEEYKTKRREKQEKQESTGKKERGIKALLKRGILKEGDEVIFNREKGQEFIEEGGREFDPDDDFWRARVTGETGMSDNVEWLHDNETYSFTGLTKEVLNELTGRNRSKSLNGYPYWIHPRFDRDLRDLRNSEIEAQER